MLLLNVSVFKVDLRANRMEEKAKQETNKKEHIFERLIRKMCQKVSTPFSGLTQAFRPHEGDLFSL